MDLIKHSCHRKPFSSSGGGDFQAPPIMGSPQSLESLPTRFSDPLFMLGGFFRGGGGSFSIDHRLLCRSGKNPFWLSGFSSDALKNPDKHKHIRTLFTEWLGPKKQKVGPLFVSENLDLIVVSNPRSSCPMSQWIFSRHWSAYRRRKDINKKHESIKIEKTANLNVPISQSVFFFFAGVINWIYIYIVHCTHLD